MPTLKKQSICIVCRKTFNGTGRYCPLHKPARKKDLRPNSGKRGYDHGWRKVRDAVLTEYGIPPHLRHLYDVDHNPPYDRLMEPDHTRYQLIPRLHADHSSKTAQEDVRRDVRGRIIGKR